MVTLCAFENPVKPHLAKTIPSHCNVAENSEGVGMLLMLGVVGGETLENHLKNYLEAEVCCRLKGS